VLDPGTSRMIFAFCKRSGGFWSLSQRKHLKGGERLVLTHGETAWHVYGSHDINDLRSRHRNYIVLHDLDILFRAVRMQDILTLIDAILKRPVGSSCAFGNGMRPHSRLRVIVIVLPTLSVNPPANESADNSFFRPWTWNSPGVFTSPKQRDWLTVKLSDTNRDVRLLDDPP
jgi:hypothetical protein